MFAILLEKKKFTTNRILVLFSTNQRQPWQLTCQFSYHSHTKRMQQTGDDTNGNNDILKDDDDDINGNNRIFNDDDDNKSGSIIVSTTGRGRWKFFVHVCLTFCSVAGRCPFVSSLLHQPRHRSCTFLLLLFLLFFFFSTTTMKLTKRMTAASTASKPSVMSFGMWFLVVWVIGVAMTMPTCDAAKTVQSQATKGIRATQSKTKSKVGPTVPRRVGVKPSTPATTKIFRFSSQQSATAQQEVLQQQQNEQQESVLTSSSSSSMPVEGNMNEGASVPNMVFNLVKCIVGAGVLGLPSGAAAVSGPGGLWKANILTVVIGAMSAYGFATIGKVCAMTGTTSYKEAWGKTVGESTSFLPVISCLLVTICSVLAYSMVLADTIPNLLQLVGVTISRTQALFTVTLTALLPLCLLKSLKALAPFSLAGIIGMIWTTVAMAIRYFDKSYTVGGALYDAVPPQLRPSSAVTVGPWTNAFVLVSMLSTASMAHYNAPKFYTELQNRTLPRYYTVVGTSAAFSVAIFSVVMTLGYLTFGQSCSGLILNNYAPQDKLMSVGRICVAMSLLCS